jgi:hypothetical protein
MNPKRAAEELQSEFSVIDLLTTARGRSLGPELLVMRSQQLKIKMYKEDGHKRPHVHIDYGGRNNHNASYAIDTGKRLAGNLHRKYDEVVRTWIAKHKGLLLELWDRLQQSNPTEMLIARLQGNV